MNHNGTTPHELPPLARRTNGLSTKPPTPGRPSASPAVPATSAAS